MTPVGAQHETPMATVNLEDVARKEWDVIVVGAGPAGAIAAREIARQDASVLLVEKSRFPRWKVCGCCLNGVGLAALDAVGLGDLPERLSAKPLNRWQLFTRIGSASCPLPTGVSLSREALDAALVREAVAAGAAFLDGTNASLDDHEGDQCALTLSQGNEHASAVSRVLVAADGLSGRLVAGVKSFETIILRDSRMGAGTVLEDDSTFYENATIYMTSSTGGYVGLVRLEDGRLDIAAALDREVVRRLGSPSAAAEAIINDVELPVPQGIHDAHWRGTPVLTRRRKVAAAHRIFLAGDAAGYVEPFTGEGIAWALLTGIAVAPLAARAASEWSSGLITEWGQTHRSLVGSRQWSCRMISKLLRSPNLASVAARVLRIAPWLARPLIHKINRPGFLPIRHNPTTKS